MYLYDTRYVLLYPPIPGRPPYTDTWQDAWDFVKRTLPLAPEPFWAQDGIEAYRVLQPGGGDQFYLNLGEAGTYPYRGEGWDAAEVDAPYEASATWATDSDEPHFCAAAPGRSRRNLHRASARASVHLSRRTRSAGAADSQRRRAGDTAAARRLADAGLERAR
jgi:hypothetical protein